MTTKVHITTAPIKMLLPEGRYRAKIISVREIKKQDDRKKRPGLYSFLRVTCEIKEPKQFAGVRIPKSYINPKMVAEAEGSMPSLLYTICSAVAGYPAKGEKGGTEITTGLSQSQMEVLDDTDAVIEFLIDEEVEIQVSHVVKKDGTYNMIQGWYSLPTNFFSETRKAFGK